MTLHRQRREIVFECDACADTLDTGTDDFGDARAELSAERWQTRKDEDTDEWNHYCPSCKGKR